MQVNQSFAVVALFSFLIRYLHILMSQPLYLLITYTNPQPSPHHPLTQSSHPSLLNSIAELLPVFILDLCLKNLYLCILFVSLISRPYRIINKYLVKRETCNSCLGNDLFDQDSNRRSPFQQFSRISDSTTQQPGREQSPYHRQTGLT